MKPKRFPNKLPNKEDPLEIPSAKLVGKYEDTFKEATRIFTYTFNAERIPKDLSKAYLSTKPLPYHEETNNSINTMPWFYTPEERVDAEIANLRHKARELLNEHYSVGKIMNEFGSSQFPYKSKIVCNKCSGYEMLYVVDFFVHIISDHGNSLQTATNQFDKILDKLERI